MVEAVSLASLSMGQKLKYICIDLAFSEGDTWGYFYFWWIGKWGDNIQESFELEWPSLHFLTLSLQFLFIYFRDVVK